MKTFVIGLPSKDESDTIRSLVEGIDYICVKLNSTNKFYLLNVDNSVDDRTSNSFFLAKTVYQKISIRNPGGIGKGSNVKIMFEKVKELGADGVIFFDTDLYKIESGWIQDMLIKLNDGYDAVFSRRKPIWNYGDLTYHLTYPLVYSYYKSVVHQPISGEFAFSKKFVEEIMKQDNFWQQTSILGYGIDIFLTVFSLNYRWCEINLTGFKDHKLRSYKRDISGYVTMRPKLQEVFDAVLYILHKLQIKSEVVQSCSFGEISWVIDVPPSFDFEIDELKQSVWLKFQNNKDRFVFFYPDLDKYFLQHDNFVGIDIKAWSEVIKLYFLDRKNCDMDIIENLFLSRVIGFFYEIQNEPEWFQVVKKNSLKLFK